MTLRANEIGADVYSTSETDLDKHNLGTRSNELEHEFDYPELAPGRALLDVENGDLYEIMHRIPGVTDTVEGRQSEYEERMNWKYRTPEGQSWGGIIQHFHISYAKRQCPTPNTHGEIQMPLTRPDENSITDIAPPAFEDSVLFDDDDTSRPFLLLERPEVTYEEAMPGDSYNILGWYDPAENDPSDRVNAMETIAHRFPDIAGVDYTTNISKALPDLGIDIEWDDMDENAAVELSRDSEGFVIDTNTSPGEFHISAGHAFGEQRFLIDSPFDAKELIKDLTSNPRWASEQTLWAVEKTRDSLVEMVRDFTAAGWVITIDGAILGDMADTNVTVNPEKEVDVSATEIFNYTFTELVEVGTGVSLPGIDVEMDMSSIDSDLVRFNVADDGTVSVSDADTPADSHAVTLTDETFGFACEKENAGLVKSLNWKDARYEFNGTHWTVNTDSAVDLLAAFINNGQTVTAPVEIITALGDEAPITEDRHVTIDEDAATHLDTYGGPEQHVDANDVTSLSDTSETDMHTIHGESVSNTSTLSLMTLDMKLADTDNGMSVDLAGSDLPGMPASVVDAWQPSADSEDIAYGWYNPETGARIIVEESEGWGTEYDVFAATPDDREPEHIVTVADERTAALTAITHLKALTR